jgi:hypothetical protein
MRLRSIVAIILVSIPVSFFLLFVSGGEETNMENVAYLTLLISCGLIWFGWIYLLRRKKKRIPDGYEEYLDNLKNGNDKKKTRV